MRNPACVPAEMRGTLFAEVQMAGLFDDGKTFADAWPRRGDHGDLEALYETQKHAPGFSLAGFVASHFALPPKVIVSVATRLPIDKHIRALWPQLTRPAEDPGDPGLLPLPHPYVVPGGRFRELYYWDSYFTLLGLLADGEQALAEGMVANFAYLIDTLGHVPNGNRRYFLSRSQPPFFALMAEAIGQIARYLPQLKREHGFWMGGSRAVRLPDGSLLNRYWDALDTPRDEAWRDDVLTARERPDRPAGEVYRALRAGAESGWDFSSRWCRGDPLSLAAIDTPAFAPIDLNSLLWHLERSIAAVEPDAATAAEFAARAAERLRAIDRHLWNPERQHYVDALWQEGGRGRHCDILTAATVSPLFVGHASAAQADAVAAVVERELLHPNGLATTLVNSGQQWDAPNGWAPLQWMAVIGLRRYGHDALAADIATRWLGTVERVFSATGRLLEKYNVEHDLPGGGGEYPTQDGFGWTNGVYLALRTFYPSSPLTTLPHT